MTARPQHALLRLLDALLHQATGPFAPGAVVCIGVVDARGGEEWWRADLEGMSARPTAGPAAEATACLLFGADAAMSILKTGKLRKNQRDVWVKGDGKLIARWVAKMTSHTSWYQLRAQI
jgi:hypothetical protein